MFTGSLKKAKSCSFFSLRLVEQVDHAEYGNIVKLELVSFDFLLTEGNTFHYHDITVNCIKLKMCFFNSKQLPFVSSFSNLLKNQPFIYSPFFSFTYYCRFSAKDFLARLNGKKLMLVGDSMNRNQFESILCILREGLQNKSKMYEIHGHKITKGRGYFNFKFEVSFSLSVYLDSSKHHHMAYFVLFSQKEPFLIHLFFLFVSLSLQDLIGWNENCGRHKSSWCYSFVSYPRK